MARHTGRIAKALFIVITAVCIDPAAPPRAMSQTAAAPQTRGITTEEIAVTMNMLIQCRNEEALAYVDSLKTEYAGEPLYLLTLARVYLGRVTAVDDNHDYVKELSKPTLDTLHEVIKICTKRIESGDDDPKYLLYRGWAWMQRAHLLALARSFYSAGREAGRGKNDLEQYLGLHPDDPVANGMLGAYLYFADAVPKVFKLLSKLLFLPTGDRGRGLEMLYRSIDSENPYAVDYVLTLNFINFFFEGRTEEGLAGTEGLLDRYPHYTRSTMALAMGSIFAPMRYVEYNTLIKKMIEGVNAGDPRDIDWNSLYVVLAFRAYTDRFLSNPRLAEARFRSIIHEAPKHPDWVEGFARFELGQIYAGDGRIEDAKRLFESVVNSSQHERFHDQARRMLENLDQQGGATSNSPKALDGLWIETVYRSGRDSLEVLFTRFENLAPESVPAAFYAGECQLLLGNMDTAAQWYQRVVDRDAPPWQDTYQMIAWSRLAEIEALAGHYANASALQSHTLDHYQNEFRFEWILDGRRQYFDRLATGEEQLPPPALLSPGRSGAAVSPGE